MPKPKKYKKTLTARVALNSTIKTLLVRTSRLNPVPTLIIAVLGLLLATVPYIAMPANKLAYLLVAPGLILIFVGALKVLQR